MLAIERRNAILTKLMADGKVLVSDLSREFDVTEETIRRDLEKLDKDGLVRKTYGGAVKNEDVKFDLPFQVRNQTNVAGKQHIASIIAEMIEDGAHLMLDSSTTALYVVRQILNRKNITVITSSIEILLELCNRSDWTVISTGGTLRDGALALVGYQAERTVSGFHVDLAICSCKGVDIERGITDSNEPEAAIKNAIFSAAAKKVLVVDSTKFDRVSFVKVRPIAAVDTVVTDCEPDEKWKNYLSQNNIELKY